MPTNETNLYSKLIEALAQSDEMRRIERADRIMWVSEHRPQNGVIMGKMDEMSLLQEAHDCFIEGHFIATLLLAVSFIEHTLSDELIGRGLAEYGEVTLASLVKISRNNLIFPDDMLNEVDRLRLIRNPFTHLKAPSHEHSLSSRFIKTNAHPKTILEKDAKDSLKLMYAFFQFTLK